MRKFASLALVLSLTIGMVGSWGQTNLEAANAATTTRLVTGTSITVTADNVRAITHPTTSSAGIVVAASDPISITQASALANMTGAAVIVSASTTNPTAVNTVVVQKNITKLTFVGAATVFPSSYRSAIDARVTTKTLVLSDSPFERSKLLAPANTTGFVVAKSTNVPAIEAALSYSSASGGALLVITGTEPANSLRTYLSPLADPTVVLAGDPGVSDQLDTDDADHYAELLVDTRENMDKSYDSVIRSHVNVKSRAANKVSIAPRDDLASFALATLVGKTEGSVTIPAGTKASITTDSAAHRYLRLLNAELKTITLIGTGTTSAQLSAAAAPSSVLRTPLPAWTITNTTLGIGSWTVAYTARAGASKYSALNWDNSVVASSTTTSMTLPGTPDYLTLAAFDSNNREIDRIYYRSNKYNAAADRITAITGTIQNGTATLRILGASGVPRKIVRTVNDPYAPLDAVRLPPETVAITCNTTFTDTGLDPQKEWNYEVVNLTLKTGSGCGSTAGTAVPASGLPIAGVTLPLTEDPYAQPGVEARRQEDLTKPRESEADRQLLLPRAGQTVSDVARQQIAYRQAHPETAVFAQPREGFVQSPAESQATAAAALTGSQFVFSYQAYIPEPIIVSPGYSGDPNKPIVIFNGSDREWYDVNNIHTKFDMRAYVGDTQVFPNKWIGETERYHCGYNVFRQIASCAFIARQTASDNGISLNAAITGSTTTLTFTANAKNPLEPFSQPINGQLTAVLGPRSWQLFGSHDRMPIHQFWWSPLYSEGKLAYMSSDPFIGCLFANAPTCTSYVNVNL